MSGVGFVFCGASKALLAALEWHERLDPSKLLDGTESRWPDAGPAPLCN